jgi:hypothetical protein
MRHNPSSLLGGALSRIVSVADSVTPRKTQRLIQLVKHLVCREFFWPEDGWVLTFAKVRPSAPRWVPRSKLALQYGLQYRREIDPAKYRVST